MEWRWALPEGVAGVFGDGSNLQPVVREYVDGMPVFQGAPEIERTPEVVRRRRGDLDGGAVYFIQADVGGPIKIGYSLVPEDRLAYLQTASPYKLVMLATWQGPRSYERTLHRQFADHRLQGEWFEPVQELLDFIAGL